MHFSIVHQYTVSVTTYGPWIIPDFVAPSCSLAITMTNEDQEALYDHFAAHSAATIRHALRGVMDYFTEGIKGLYYLA